MSKPSLEKPQGAYVAIVTPFRNGKIDEEGLKTLIEFQINNGTHGIVVCGTTGESPTLNDEEFKFVIKFVIDEVAGKVPVLAGTGSNSTEKAIKLTQFAQDAGADGSLSVCPYYNKPTQAGIIEHFEYLTKECSLPIILYNIPGRCGVNMEPETIIELSNIESIIGVKEASGSIQQASQIIANTSRRFSVLSGDDALTLPILALGGKGVISTTSNVAPKFMAELCNQALDGNFKEAKRLHYELLDLFNALFCESNPAPTKTALSLMGVISNEIRLPLTVLKPENVELVRSTLKKLNLI